MAGEILTQEQVKAIIAKRDARIAEELTEPE